MSAAALKERLRADLKSAMQAKDTTAVRVLRTLVAALDNAEAVPGESGHVPRKFGDPGAEVARRELAGTELIAILSSEAQTRLDAAADYERHGRTDQAALLRDEARLVARYLQA